MLPAPFDLPFMQRALLEVVLLAGIGGVLGTWVVLRRLAFFSHAVGTAAFPGLVVAAAWSIPPAAAALACGVAMAGALERLGRRARVDQGAATGLLLVGALAVGVVLASDVFESGAGVDRLLFGSLLAVGDADLVRTAVVLAVVLAADLAHGRRWLTAGFDDAAPASGAAATRRGDGVLLLVVVLAVVVAIDAVGALLVTVALVLPAAAARLVTARVATLKATAVALALVEGIAGLWLAFELDVGPGPAIAVVGGAAFFVLLGVGALRPLRARRAVRAA